MSLTETAGNSGISEPGQNGPIASNSGLTGASMVMVSCVEVAHSFELGVNEYVVDVVLSISGNHVPLMPSIEVSGKLGIVDPTQKGPTGENEGTTG